MEEALGVEVVVAFLQDAFHAWDVNRVGEGASWEVEACQGASWVAWGPWLMEEVQVERLQTVDAVCRPEKADFVLPINVLLRIRVFRLWNPF